MKKLLLSVALLATSLVASAQSTSNNGNIEGWSGMRFSYAPTTLLYDFDDVDVKFNGFSIEYIKGFGIVNDLPLFLEAGAGLEWLMYNNSESDLIEGLIKVKIEESCNFFAMNVPVNLGYRFSLDESVSIMPYVGLKARLGLSATNKITTKVSYGGDTEKESETYNQYDEDDVNYTLKRFLLGWQVGATAAFNQFTVGVNYGTCFTDEVYNEIESKLGAVTFSVGYTF